MGYTEVLTRSVVASGALTGKRFVGLDGAVAGLGARAQGVALFDCDDTKTASVIALGSAIVEAGGAFEAGSLLEVGASGKAVDARNGHVVARALETSSGDGVEVEILVLEPTAVDIAELAAGGAVVARRFVTAEGEQAVAGARVLGVAVHAAAEEGDLLVQTGAVAYVDAGAAVEAGAVLESDALGRAVTLVNGHPAAVALEAAAQAGDVIAVRLLAPSTEPVIEMTAGVGGLTAGRFAQADGTLPAAGEAVAGVSVSTALATGDTMVRVGGIARVVAGAAVAAGAVVESAADGKAIPHQNGVPAGVALDAAEQANDVIRVQLLPSTAAPVVSLVAGAGGLTAKLFAQADGTLAGAGEAAIGVAVNSAAQAAAARVRTGGIAYVVAGAGITAGAAVQSDVASKAVTATTGERLGQAIDAAAQANDVIRIQLGAFGIAPT
jgi:hypothetical protein